MSQNQIESIRKELMVGASLPSLARFSLMMLFSVVIAAVGLIQNSAAVVIGAMMIAPLLSPILGVAVALLRGSAHEIFTGLRVIVTSASGSIFFAYLISKLFPPTSTVLTTEMLARTSPDVRDMLVALAAGAAGAYAICHKDAAGAIPGVAVAVALVPPLAATGVLLGRDQPSLAFGAFLLFVTNLFGILVAAAFIFYSVGLIQVHKRHMRTRKGILAFAFTLVPTLALAVFLTLQFSHVATDARNLRAATNAVSEWMGPIGDIEEVSLKDRSITIRISSPSTPPSIENLNVALNSALKYAVTIDLRWIPIEQDKFSQEKDSGKVTSAARTIVRRWLQVQGLSLNSLTIENGSWYISSAGPTPPKDSADLVMKLKTEIGYRPSLNISWIQTTAKNPLP